nr:MAG TPA: hypothetical protein [Caudoviricetes sp.]
MCPSFPRSIIFNTAIYTCVIEWNSYNCHVINGGPNNNCCP